MHTFNQSLHLFTVRFYQTNTSRVTVAFVSMNDHKNRGIKLIKGYRQLYKVLKWYLWLFEHRVWGVQHSIFALFTRTAFFFFSFVCYLSGRVFLYLSVSLFGTCIPSTKLWNVTIRYCVGSIEEMSNNLYIFSTTNVCTGDEFTNRFYLALFFCAFSSSRNKSNWRTHTVHARGILWMSSPIFKKWEDREIKMTCWFQPVGKQW